MSYPLVPGVQLASIAITAAFYTHTNSHKWLIAVYIFAFSHYLVGAIYSRKGVIQVLSSPKNYLPLALLALGGWIAYTQSFPLLLYFGLHHALSEGYLKQRIFTIQLSEPVLSRLQSASFWIHISGFFLLVRHDRSFFYDSLLIPSLLVFLVALSIYGHTLWVNKKNLNRTQILMLGGSELILLGLLGVSFFYQITFLQVVFYHFTLWALLPFLKASSRQAIKPLTIYVSLTAISLALIVYFSPYNYPISSRFHLFEHWFILLSYVHITLSFAVSNANPAWAIRLFSKRPAVHEP